MNRNTALMSQHIQNNPIATCCECGRGKDQCTDFIRGGVELPSLGVLGSCGVVTLGDMVSGHSGGGGKGELELGLMVLKVFSNLNDSINNKITLLLSYYWDSTERGILPILLDWEMKQKAVIAESLSFLCKLLNDWSYMITTDVW